MTDGNLAEGNMTDNKINLKYDIVIIGGGPAGMSAAIAAYEHGNRSILIIEREKRLGGILKQCIHPGFGLEMYKEELTGPEFAARLIAKVREYNIDCRMSSMVLDIDRKLCVTGTSSDLGVFTVQAGAVILAMGCRERPRGALNTPGTRPSGVFTAGAAQYFVNMYGYLPGKEVVILGSGDIGLIMARRMTLEGAKVKAVCEVMPYSGGLARNIEQCLNDFNIPLLLSHTVVEVHGKERVTGVTIAQVENVPGKGRVPVKGTEQYIPCDTLLLSVGLIPENELTTSCGIRLNPATKGAEVDQDRQTEIPGIYSCGNVLHVHDLADFAAEEARIAGEAAAERVRKLRENAGEKSCEEGGFKVGLKADGKVRYVVPQVITAKKDVNVFFRVSDIFKKPTLVVTASAGAEGAEGETGENVLLKKKYLKLVPGTMQTVTLKKEMLEQIPDGGRIEFKLLPGDAE